MTDLSRGRIDHDEGMIQVLPADLRFIRGHRRWAWLFGVVLIILRRQESRSGSQPDGAYRQAESLTYVRNFLAGVIGGGRPRDPGTRGPPGSRDRSWISELRRQPAAPCLAASSGRGGIDRAGDGGDSATGRGRDRLDRILCSEGGLRRWCPPPGRGMKWDRSSGPAPHGPAAKPVGRSDGAGRMAAGGGPGEMSRVPVCGPRFPVPGVERSFRPVFLASGRRPTGPNVDPQHR